MEVLLIVFFSGFSSLLTFLIIEKKHRNKIIFIEEKHRLIFREMINQFNHEGTIPGAATATGLTNIIISGLLRVILSLENLLKEKDWNTKENIIELQEIVGNELVLLRNKLEDFLTSRRNTLRKFNKKQE